MSSVGRGYSIRPTTRFVANGNVNYQGGPGTFTGGAWLVTFAEIYPTCSFFRATFDQPFINLKCKFATFENTDDLVAALNAVWNNVSLTTQPYETLLDMGREIKFGVKGGQSDLVTFRVVQRTNGLASAGGVGGAASYGVGNDVGFNTYLVPIENRLSGGALADVFPVQISRQ
jgi:hypothetical protein